VLELDWRGKGKGLLIVDSVQMMTPAPMSNKYIMSCNAANMRRGQSHQ
jgi:hypothetical protein